MTLKIWIDRPRGMFWEVSGIPLGGDGGLLNTFSSMAADPSLEEEGQSEIQELHRMEMRTDKTKKEKTCPNVRRRWMKTKKMRKELSFDEDFLRNGKNLDGRLSDEEGEGRKLKMEVMLLFFPSGTATLLWISLTFILSVEITKERKD